MGVGTWEDEIERRVANLENTINKSNFSAGLVGDLVEWLEKELIALKEAQQKQSTESLSDYVWGQTCMVEKVMSKIKKLKKTN